ncbi:MAG: hypothetical protein LIP08_03745 [Bacteroides sp.]|nr:hypothetical protein [Bacteroides sp.]
MERNHILIEHLTIEELRGVISQVVESKLIEFLPASTGSESRGKYDDTRKEVMNAEEAAKLIGVSKTYLYKLTYLINLHTSKRYHITSPEEKSFISTALTLKTGYCRIE